jgi:hypothetical protein
MCGEGGIGHGAEDALGDGQMLYPAPSAHRRRPRGICTRSGDASAGRGVSRLIQNQQRGPASQEMEPPPSAPRGGQWQAGRFQVPTESFRVASGSPLSHDWGFTQGPLLTTASQSSSPLCPTFCPSGQFPPFPGTAGPYVEAKLLRARCQEPPQVAGRACDFGYGCGALSDHPSGMPSLRQPFGSCV